MGRVKFALSPTGDTTLQKQSDFQVVGEMYKKFGMIYDVGAEKPHLLPIDVVKFRLQAMIEELKELQSGYATGDLPVIADSLVDLVVFALGTAHLHGLPWEELFDEVQRANMDKQVGVLKKERNGPEGSVDLVKPEGWKPPDIEGVLKKRGWH